MLKVLVHIIDGVFKPSFIRLEMFVQTYQALNLRGQLADEQIEHLIISLLLGGKLIFHPQNQLLDRMFIVILNDFVQIADDLFLFAEKADKEQLRIGGMLLIVQGMRRDEGEGMRFEGEIGRSDPRISASAKVINKFIAFMLMQLNVGVFLW